jgi:hypothetical protein
MVGGYVYVLLNTAMDGIVKIGSTTDSSEARAADISRATGVPTAFLVVYEEFVPDCKEAERRVHARLAQARVNPRREFFRVPPKVAVKVVQEVAREFITPVSPVTGEAADVVEILPALKAKYPQYLRPEIVSVQVARGRSACYLEIHSKPGQHFYDEDIVFVDLAIVWDDNAPLFPVSRSAAENASAFLGELDPYSIIMCTPLFTEAAAQEIAEVYESGRA